MAGDEEIAMLNRGAVAWNEWRRANPDRAVDLSGASLVWATSSAMPVLREIDLSGADLNRIYHQAADRDYPDEWGPDLSGAKLRHASARGAHLFNSRLRGADLRDSDFSEAVLFGVDFAGADLTGASFRGARLSEVDFSGAILNRVDISGATLSKCAVWGTASWDIKTDEGTTTRDFATATGYDQAKLTADSMEMLQLLHFIQRNPNVKLMIDSLTQKMVLILGRFSEPRKAVLDACRERLRTLGFLPVVFDFLPSSNRDLSETIGILGSLSRFVLADLSEAKSIPQELQIIVPNLPSVIVAPIIQSGMEEYAMFEHFRRYPWVLEPVPYDSIEDLMNQLGGQVEGSMSVAIGPLLARIDAARSLMVPKS
jgi:uncharacterized protein YjbI with pentapeptide repeats